MSVRLSQVLGIVLIIISICAIGWVLIAAWNLYSHAQFIYNGDLTFGERTMSNAIRISWVHGTTGATLRTALFYLLCSAGGAVALCVWNFVAHGRITVWPK